jgi:tight adherence protein B
MTLVLWTGVVCLGGSLALLGLVLLGPRRARVPLTRLDPGAQPAPGRLASATEDAAAVADRVLGRLNRTDRLEAALEKAGMKIRPAELLVGTAASALGAGAPGLLLGGVPLGLLMAAAAPAGAVALVGARRRKRQKAFTEQLDDSLQLMASSLRAGHSVLRALDAVSRDTEAPTSVEFARVVNETRVGRDMHAALEEVAERTGSEDFAWVVQAISIHREVGGNLAEVLDGVGATIRDRNQLRRQVASLSAEGRVSGVVLLIMPVVVTGLLFGIAPGLMSRLTGTGTGLVLLTIAGSLMVVGALWLRKIVQVRY